jgi:hypothetical protein
VCGSIFELRKNVVHKIAARSDRAGRLTRDEDLCRERLIVVGRGHRHAVGARAEDSENVAFGHWRKCAIAGEEIAGFADGTDNVARVQTWECETLFTSRWDE